MVSNKHEEEGKRQNAKIITTSRFSPGFGHHLNWQGLFCSPRIEEVALPLSVRILEGGSMLYLGRDISMEGPDQGSSLHMIRTWNGSSTQNFEFNQDGILHQVLCIYEPEQVTPKWAMRRAYLQSTVPNMSMSSIKCCLLCT